MNARRLPTNPSRCSCSPARESRDSAGSANGAIHFFSRRFLPFTLLALSALFTGGCAGVYALKPVGEKPAELDPAKWEGTWLASFGPKPTHIQLKVVNRATGELHLSATEADAGKTKTETATVFVRQAGNRFFVNVQEKPGEPLGGDKRDPGSKEVRHAWGLIKLQADLLFVWAPDVAKFTGLVKTGKLKGREVQGGDIVLEPLSDVETRLLAAEEFGVPFPWDSPVVFRRINPASP